MICGIEFVDYTAKFGKGSGGPHSVIPTPCRELESPHSK